MRFSIRSLFLLILIAAVSASGARWWLRVSEERRDLCDFDPKRDQIFDWPDDHKAMAMPVLDDLRAELLDAAWFGSQQRKLAICNRHIDLLVQSTNKWYQPELRDVFKQLGGILRLPDDETAKLVDRFRSLDSLRSEMKGKGP